MKNKKLDILNHEVNLQMEWGCPSKEMALEFIAKNYNDKEVRELAKEQLKHGK